MFTVGKNKRQVPIIVTYAPTNDVYEKIKRDSTANSNLIPRHDILLIIGDFDARVGNNNKDTERTMVKHALANAQIMASTSSTSV